MSWEPAVMSGVGGMVGMGVALGYGFKKLVDVVAVQLYAQNEENKAMRVDISDKLDKHINDCKDCKTLQREVLDVSRSSRG